MGWLASLLRRFWPGRSASPHPNDFDSFPSTLLRGMRSSSWRNSKGDVKAGAFEPDAKTIERRRTEGVEPVGAEISINWEDKEEVLTLTLRDQANAKHGAARMSVIALEYVRQTPGCPGALWWERRKLAKNPYHGNLVFPEGLAEHEIFLLQNLLAAHARCT